MAKLTDEQVQFNKELAEVLGQMKDEFNGCPLFEGREKGALDDIEGKELHIAEIFPIQDYHCVVFEELPDTYYLTGGALKDLCNNYPPKFVVGRCVLIQPLVDTKSRRKYRPIKVLA